MARRTSDNVGNNEKVRIGLANKEIRADLHSDKMLDMCVPAFKREIGRFTEYNFEIMPGYWGITIIAKDGRLKRAFEWSCPMCRTYFDEMNPDDEKQHRSLRAKHENVPQERMIG